MVVSLSWSSSSAVSWKREECLSEGSLSVANSCSERGRVSMAIRSCVILESGEVYIACVAEETSRGRRRHLDNQPIVRSSRREKEREREKVLISHQPPVFQDGETRRRGDIPI